VPLRAAACGVAALLGCFNDTDCQSGGCAHPLLPRYQAQLHDKVTLEACASACNDLQLTVGGIDAGNHCFCGSTADLATAPARSRSRPLAECQVTLCHAAPAEKCGGSGRLLTFNYSCSAGPPPPSPPQPPPPALASDGGHFGNWALDAAGLPVFRYTLDQSSTEGAATAAAYFALARQSSTEWRNKTDNLFEIGNDRLVVVASSFGYVQVRQDELGPKFLQDVNPPAHQFGGGIVYLIDSETRELLASSFFTGQEAAAAAAGRPVNRSFGIGYRTVETGSTGGQYRLQHELLSPFGDDPVVLSTVTVTSAATASGGKHLGTASSPRKLAVVEVWGTKMWQQQCGGPSAAIGSRAQRCTNEAVRSFQKEHYATTTTTSGSTLLSHTVARNVSTTQPTHWDATPPDTFLFAVPVDSINTSPMSPTPAGTVMGCDAASFFGAGGAASPAFKISACDSSSDHGALIIERPVPSATYTTSQAAASADGSSTATLHQAYGYIPSGFTLAQLQQKYDTAGVVKARAALGPLWKSGTIGFDAPAHPEVGREVSWNAGYLRQALTRYDFFNESMLDQGSQYRYAAGFEGAARDPLQHALPLVLMAPERAASVLRMALSQLVPKAAWGPPKPAGPYSPTDDAWNTPYALYGSGRVDNIVFGVQLSGASDLELYLLLLASEYVLASKDVSFLSQRITYRFKADRAPPGQPDRSVLQVLADAYAYLTNHTGTGQHGLLRVQSGDWNDGFSGLAGCGSNKACQHEVQLEAESVMNSAMATFILSKFAQVLELAAKANAAEVGLDPATVRGFAEAQKKALQEFAWNGNWLSRAWLPRKGFVGTQSDSLGMTLEPQGWALLSGMLNTSQQQRIVVSLEERLNSDLGGWRQSRTGHFWAALSHPTIMGLARVNKTAAWEKWVATSLGHEARRFPSLWPGVWTAADYIDPASGRSGGSAFPALCTHRHAWPLYSLATGLVGLEFTAVGLSIRPAGLPITSSTQTQPGARGGDILWAFTSVVANVTAHTTTEFSGRYHPVRRSDSCLVTLEVPMAVLPSHHATFGGKAAIQTQARIVAATTGPATAWWLDDIIQKENGAGRVVEQTTDEQGRAIARVELRPSGGGGQCGEDLAVEWHVRL
jgi:hypothetical protein